MDNLEIFMNILSLNNFEGLEEKNRTYLFSLMKKHDLFGDFSDKRFIKFLIKYDKIITHINATKIKYKLIKKKGMIILNAISTISNTKNKLAYRHFKITFDLLNRTIKYELRNLDDNDEVKKNEQDDNLQMDVFKNIVNNIVDSIAKNIENNATDKIENKSIKN